MGMKRRKPIRRAARTPDAEAQAFVAWVRTRQCRVWWMVHHGEVVCGVWTECLGVIHAHHAGERGLGQKADDWTCIPLCARHHGEIHDCRGTFAGWGKALRREWSAEQIRATRAEWNRIRAVDPDRDLPF